MPDSRPPFIGTQRLWELNCLPGEEFDHLRPERFRVRRMLERSRLVTVKSSWPPPGTTGCA